jgi:hypothetical protein
VSAKAYATSVCRALAPFERQIAAGSAALDPVGSSNTTAAQRKRMLERFLGQTANASDAAVAGLKAAGHPEIRNGQKIANAFVTAFTRLANAMDSAATASRKLPTNSPTAFKAAATSIGNSVRRSVGGGVEAGLAGLRSRALESAAAKVAACHALE